MTIPYEAYWQTAFVQPMCLLVLCLIAFGGAAAWRFWGDRKTNQPKAPLWLGVMVFALIIVFLSWAFARVGIPRLFYGGIYLALEREKDAISMDGIVERIVATDKDYFGSYELEYDHEEHPGWILTIDGTKCVTMRKGDIELGDRVTVEYLPKSRYVLYVEKLEEA